MVVAAGFEPAGLLDRRY